MRAVRALIIAMGLAGCEDSAGERARQQLAELQKKKEEQARAAKEAKERASAPAESVKLPPPYGDESAAGVVWPDGPCPPGLWALFPGPAPGETPEVRTAAEAGRKDALAALTAGTFVVKLRAPVSVLLAPYDAAAGRFVIEVVGAIDCRDASGERITVAWTPAKLVDPGPAAGGLRENLWKTPLLRFALPMKSLSEAKEFNDRNRLALSARVALKFLRGRVDHKQIKGPTGAMEEWGAGRLAEASVVGIRLATKRETVELLDERPAPVR